MSSPAPSLLRSVAGFSAEVGQNERLVVLRVGRASGPARGPGRHRLIPGLDRGIVVDMSRRTLEGAPVSMATVDRATIAVGIRLRWQVIDPLNSMVLTGPLEQALLGVATTGARGILAGIPLDQLTARWWQIESQLATDLAPAFKQWGVALLEIGLSEAAAPRLAPGTSAHAAWLGTGASKYDGVSPVMTGGYLAIARWRLRVLLAVVIFIPLVLLATGRIYPAQFIPVTVPVGAAAHIPPNGSVHKIYLVPLDSMPANEVEGLAAFFEARYGLSIEVLPVVAGAVPDPTRHQVPGAAEIALLRALRPDIARASDAILIGITNRGLYSTVIPTWHFEFAERDAPLGIISNADMVAFPILGDSRAESRLRKMLGRDIGILYYGLGPSSDPKSLLYQSVLGTLDLDNMDEEF